MLSTVKNAWRIPDLRKKMLFTLLILIVYRLGSHIPVSGVDPSVLSRVAQGNGALSFYDLIAGGAFSKFSIFAMSVMPYINASIIMQLLTIAIPPLERLSKEGEEGRRKIQNYTRILALVISVVLAYGSYNLMYNYGGVVDKSGLNLFVIILSLTAGSMFLMWLGDQITIKGIGNGVSLLIFINIISGFPTTIYQISTAVSGGDIDPVQLMLFIAAMLALLFVVVVMSLAERRIPVQYAGRAVGNKTSKGQLTHMPFGLISTSVIAIIFAMSVMNFPTAIGNLFPQTSWWNTYLVHGKYSPFNNTTVVYIVCYAVFIILFSWFYSQITYKPDEMAENMHKSGAFIPGIRPGNPTAVYIEKVLTKISLVGGTFAAVIAVAPIILNNYSSFKGISFGGTSLLIMVSFALETVRQIESQLISRHYQGFLK